MRPHGEHNDGCTEGQADPEPPCEVDKFGVGAGIRRWNPHRLQRHAANRTVAKFFTYDFRIHRAGVERAFGHGRFRGASGGIVRWRRLEFFIAMVRTKIKTFSIMALHPFCMGALDFHAANGIFGGDVRL